MTEAGVRSVAAAAASGTGQVLNALFTITCNSALYCCIQVYR